MALIPHPASRLVRTLIPALMLFGAAPAVAQNVIVESEFDSDAEGWVVITNEPGFPPVSPGAVTWQAAGGNPDG
ncbi:MAG: hypothetical protein H6819_05470 [Phycisphaerales bacterium]|nr:hypothetical protein [Phycisphaerales bacterium]MCB9854771.1 hypothetical protein [Phycisphaerales bacterium]MCB9863757.1 hypothetical protein [Phycisphaerales bacterium]